MDNPPFNRLGEGSRQAEDGDGGSVDTSIHSERSDRLMRSSSIDVISPTTTNHSHRHRQTNAPTPSKPKSNVCRWGVVWVVLLIGGSMGCGYLFHLYGFDHSSTPKSPDNDFDSSILPLYCDVAVLGAGIGGVYTAYSLAATMAVEENKKWTVCLIEKENRLGGRVYDIARNGYPNDRFGVGALRVVPDHHPLMTRLAIIFNILLEREEHDRELMHVRGRFFSRDLTADYSEIDNMCSAVFPEMDRMTVAAGNNSNGDRCKVLPTYGRDPDVRILEDLQALFRKDEKGVMAKHADWPNFVLSEFGDEGLAFIRECVRYNSVFSSVSLHGMLDFLRVELTFNPHRSYPKGGMSRFIDAMEKAMTKTKQSVTIKKGEEVKKIDMVDPVASGGYNFKITSTKQNIMAKKVFCAIDPYHLRQIKGNVVSALMQSEHFTSIAPKRLAIVTAWWPTRWWEQSIPIGRKVPISEEPVSRVISHESCFSTMDIPQFPYGRDQNVTRVVYDDGVCVDTWDYLSNAEPGSHRHELLRDTVMKSMANVFPDVKDIPLPLQWHGYVHPNAWHFQHPSSTKRNNETAQWAIIVHWVTTFHSHSSVKPITSIMLLGAKEVFYLQKMHCKPTWDLSIVSVSMKMVCR